MTDAEIAVIRSRQGLCCCQSCTDRRALLAHIDAQAAEITDREGKYVDLLRTKHALTAEVERLNKLVNDDQTYQRLLKEGRDLRDLVREAGERIDDLTTYGAAATVRNEKAWSDAVAKADAWQKKAQA